MANEALGGSMSEGSDAWLEFSCSACDKDGRVIEAEKYCVECDENLCAQCVKQHNRFGVMKTHQLHDKYFKARGVGHSLPNQRCGRHSGKLIDVYCKIHDALCCAICVALEHRNCDGIVYIPEAVKDSKFSEEMKQLEIDRKYIKVQLSNVKQEMENYFQNLKDNKRDLLKQIHDFRNKVNSHLDRMEKHVNDDINADFQCKMNVLNSDMERVDDAVASLERQEQLLETIDKENKSEIFVQIKMGENNVSAGADLLKEIEQTTLKRVSFLLNFDYNVKKMIEESESLAVFTQENNVSSAKLADEFSVRIPEDTNVPMISGMCEIENAEMIITDSANSRIKKLDENFRVTSFVDLKAQPFSVCSIGVNTVAVTMANSKVQFVFVNKPMVRTLSFVTGKGCSGISHFNKELYVCCGGDNMPGSVEVYDLHGSHLRSYFQEFAMPMELALNTRTKTMYITDKMRGLVIMDRNFVLQSIIKNKDLENQLGICLTGDTQVLIGGYQTNNIALFNMNGKFIKYLLTATDGVQKPTALCYLSKQHSLVVSMYNSDKVKLFSLKDT